MQSVNIKQRAQSGLLTSFRQPDCVSWSNYGFAEWRPQHLGWRGVSGASWNLTLLHIAVRSGVGGKVNQMETTAC